MLKAGTARRSGAAAGGQETMLARAMGEGSAAARRSGQSRVERQTTVQAISP